MNKAKGIFFIIFMVALTSSAIILQSCASSTAPVEISEENILKSDEFVQKGDKILRETRDI